MAFEWLVKLNDMVSDPATRIARSLHDVEQQLLAIDYAVKRRNLALMNPGIKKDIAALETQKVKLQVMQGQLNNLGHVSSSLVQRFKHLREATRDWLLILTPLAMGLKFVLNSAAQMAHAIVAPIRAIEEARIGLRTMFGTKIGDELVQEITNLGPRIGRPIAGLFDQATKFSTAGAPSEWIKPLLLAMADMQAMGKDVGKLGYDLSAGFSRPVADLNEMRRGLTGVVDETLVWKQMTRNIFGKDTGSAVGNLNKLMSLNKLAGSEFSKAVIQVIAAMSGGHLGAKAFERADTTLGGMLDRLEARMEKLFMGIESSKGFKTLKLAMKNLIDVLGTSDTQKKVNDFVNNLGTALEPLTGPAGKKNMMDFFTAMSKSIDDVLPGLKAIVRVTGWFAKRMLEGVGGFAKGAELLSELATMQGGPVSNVLNAIPGMLTGPGVQLSDESQSRLGSPYQQFGTPLLPGTRRWRPNPPPLNVSIPITIHADTASKYQDLIPDESKADILGRVSDAIDQINSQNGDGLPAGVQ